MFFIKERFKRIISLTLMLVITFNICASTVMASNNLIISSSVLDRTGLDYINSIDFTLKDLGLNEKEIDFLRVLREEDIYYIPSYGELYSDDYYSDELFNIEVINRLFGLNIKYDNSNYTIEEKIERLSREDEIYLSSMYYYIDLEKFVEGFDANLSSPYMKRNIYIVAREGVTLDNAYDIGVSENLGNYSVDKINLMGGEKVIVPKEEAREKLENDELDIYICEKVDVKNIVANSDLVYYKDSDVVYDTNLYLVTGRSPKKDLFMECIDKIYANPEIMDIYKHFNRFILTKTSKDIFASHLTDEEKKAIEEKKELNVGFISTPVLFENRLGKYEGIIYEYLEILSIITGVEMNYYVYVNSDYDKILEDMYNNKIDLIPIALNNYRQNEYLKSEFPYLDLHVTDPFLFANLDIVKMVDTPQLSAFNDLNFAQIGMLSSDMLILDNFLRNINFVNYDNLSLYKDISSMLNDLKKGRISYIIALPGFLQYVNKTYNYNVNTADDVIRNNKKYKWGFLINETYDNKEMHTIINKAIPTLLELYLEEEYLNPNVDYMAMLKKGLKREEILISFLVMTFIIMIYILYSLRSAKQTVNELDYIVSYDELTRVRNFNNIVMNTDIRKDYLLILLKVYDLKKIIDLYGTDIGESILIETADRLKKLDTSYNINLYKTADDGFVLIFTSERSTVINEKEISRKLIDCLEKRFVFSKFNSIVDFKIASLDSRIYKDKLINNYNLLNNKLHDVDYKIGITYRYLTNDELVSSLRTKQIERQLTDMNIDDFIPYLQPLISAKTGKVIGCEVLARMVNNTGGILGAYEFIPIAKKKGLLGKLDEIFLEKTIVLRTEWIKKGIIDEDFYFSVNASVQFLKNVDSIFLKKLKYKYDLENFDFLQIEVLEEFMESNFMASSIEVLKNSNLRVAIDDFSAGHSSLTRITDKEFNVVKLDRGIIPINLNEEHKIILKFIVKLLKDMDYKIIAEGIETKEHVDLLTNLGVDIFQGYFYAKPLPKNEFIIYLDKNK